MLEKLIKSVKNLKTKLGKWFWFLIVVLVVVLIVVLSLNKKGVKVETTSVSKGELLQTISTSGSVKADQYSVLTFPTGGMVTWVGVISGQKVYKGQSIAQIDTTSLNAAYQNSLNNYRNTQAAVDLEHDNDKNYGSAENFLQKATRTAAEVANDNAYNAVLVAQENLRNATIYAPFSGVMDTVSPSSPGINTIAGTANYTLVNPSSVYFDAEVEETDLPSLKIGQEVNIKLDAYPDEILKGSLSTIGMVAFTSSTGGNAYHVRISLPKELVATSSANYKFRVGMKGDADIILATLPNVLKVNSSAVMNDGTNDYIWVIDSGKVKKIIVTLGPSSDTETEIKSGLNENQQIIDNPSSTLKEGQKATI